MNEKDNPVTTPETAADDQIQQWSNRDIIERLAATGFPPLERDHGTDDTADHPLNADDRRAFERLGTPREQVARLIASTRGTTEVMGGSSQAEESTQAWISALDETEPADVPLTPEAIGAMKELRLQTAENASPGLLRCDSGYRIQKIIGRGGQGTVHLLESLDEPNLPKALKIFSPVPYRDTDSYYKDMERMHQVAAELYRMQADNLVIVEKTQYRNDIFEMLMRWIDGRDLAELMRPSVLQKVRSGVTPERWRHLTDVVVTSPTPQRVCLQPGMAANIVEKCLRALDALHRHGIVHGDIKPSNIMLDQYGSIRVIDIGSAFKISDPPMRYTWTPRYAPPEIFRGEAWTPQSDLASLGYVLIELLSGRPAVDGPAIESYSTRTRGSDWRGEQMKEKLELSDRLGEILPSHVLRSQRLVSIIRSLIDPDPRQRFSTAADALEGPTSTYQFQQDLARMSLSVPYCQEIKRWLTDVMNVS